MILILIISFLSKKFKKQQENNSLIFKLQQNKLSLTFNKSSKTPWITIKITMAHQTLKNFHTWSEKNIKDTFMGMNFDKIMLKLKKHVIDFLIALLFTNFLKIFSSLKKLLKIIKQTYQNGHQQVMMALKMSPNFQEQKQFQKSKQKQSCSRHFDPMCMFDKMFEEGGHKFRKRSPKQAATVTNPKVTASYNPSRDNFERNFYQNVKDWRSIPPTGYQWKCLQEQVEQVEEEKPFSYLAIGGKSTHYDENQSLSQSFTEKKKKKIKKDKHKKKHSKNKKEKKEKKSKKQKKNRDKKKIKQKHKKDKDRHKKHKKSHH